MLIQYCVPASQMCRFYPRPRSHYHFSLFYQHVCSRIYAGIIRTSSRRSGTLTDERMTEGVTSARNQVARLRIVNGMLSLLGQTPYRAMSIFYITKADTGGEEIFSPTVYGITLIVSPFVCLVTNSFYRQSFRDAFFQKSEKCENAGTKLLVVFGLKSWSANKES